MEFLPVCSVADTGLLGRALEPIILHKFYRKLHENERNWTETSLALPRSATDVGTLGKTLMNIVDSSPTSDI